MWVVVLILQFSPLRSCEVENGKEVHCHRELFTGTAVISRNHMIRSCQINEGRIERCGGPYTGMAPVWRKNKWWNCMIRKGLHPDRNDRRKETPCADVFTGTVVVYRKLRGE